MVDIQRHHYEVNWWTLLVSPVVLLIIAFGLWVSVSAVLENSRLARMSGEILSVVALARDMAIDYRANDEQATRVLFERLAQTGIFEIVSPDDPTKRGFVNPWGELGSIGLLPSEQALRFRTRVSPVVCRRFLALYAKAAPSLGLARVDVREEDGFSSWRTLYTAPLKDRAETVMDSFAIQSGCGNTGLVLLSLTFRLSKLP